MQLNYWKKPLILILTLYKLSCVLLIFIRKTGNSMILYGIILKLIWWILTMLMLVLALQHVIITLITFRRQKHGHKNVLKKELMTKKKYIIFLEIFSLMKKMFIQPYNGIYSTLVSRKNLIRNILWQILLITLINKHL